MCNIGDIGICKHCDGEIVFVDPDWEHPGKTKPQHRAEPRKVFSDEIEVLRLEINRLELKPTDMLVIKFPENTSGNDIAFLREEINKVIPEGVSGIILRGDIQIYTISKSEEGNNNG